MTRYEWVTVQKAEGFPTTTACEVAGVSTSAFNDWCRRKAAGPTEAEIEEARLVAEIHQIHDEFDGTYGEPRMTAELQARGWRVNHKRVERLMRVHGIVGVHKPAKVRTTIPAEHAPPLPDLVGRLFDPGQPDVAWVGDITYIPTAQGWLYLASVLDLGSRRWLGYSMADHMRTQLVTDALDMAAAARGGATEGIVFHSDRGSQAGFNWLSQHLDHGGVSWFVDNRQQIVRFGRSCGRLVIRSSSGMSRRCSGPRSPRVCSLRKHPLLLASLRQLGLGGFATLGAWHRSTSTRSPRAAISVSPSERR